MSDKPDHASIERLLQEGRSDEAERRLREFLHDNDDDPAAAEMLARTLRRQGRHEDALAICEELLRKSPARASAWREAGRACNNLGQLRRARKFLEEACRLAPAETGLLAHSAFDLGHVCQRLGDVVAARRAWERAKDLEPHWPSPLLRLGLLELSVGEFGKAEQLIEQAVGLDDANAEAWTALGVARHRQGRNTAASDAYERALALQPENPDALGNLAISLHDDGRLEEAIAGYRKVLQRNRGDVRAATHLADALLEAGACAEAMSVADGVLEKFPGHSGAIASRGVALRRLRRDREYAALMDLDALVFPIDIAVPAGYKSLDEFNAALSRHVQEHESLRYEPAGHATRHGHHTGDLLRYEKGPVAALEKAISLAVDGYGARLERLPDHPLARTRPQAWKLSLWSVVMGNKGHQLAHIHPSAWLSGVYYAQLPAAISVDDEKQSGWIEFGRPPEKLAGATSFPFRRFLPQAGRMFLFPAFFYHQTVPFSSSEPRISLAFDVAPAASRSATI